MFPITGVIQSGLTNKVITALNCVLSKKDGLWNVADLPPGALGIHFLKAG